ncbi:MAG TPA: ABC transporter permease, partial [Alphaproteobacteria bacterium]|nr:ABC transporter permease [Alphaproteobacteria bacterium]
AIFGPMLHPVDPFEMVWAPFTPPGQDGFVLGTDYLGRDMLAALLNGGRVSLTIGLVAALMSVFIGISFGALAGFYRG